MKEFACSYTNKYKTLRLYEVNTEFSLIYSVRLTLYKNRKITRKRFNFHSRAILFIGFNEYTHTYSYILHDTYKILLQKKKTN